MSVSAFIRNAGLVSHLERKGSQVTVTLATCAGKNKVGHLTARQGRWFYRVENVQVGEGNQNKGFARLLYILVNGYGVKNNLWQLPTHTYTLEGQRLRRYYALRPERRLKDMIDTAQKETGVATDIPWKLPPPSSIEGSSFMRRLM